MKSAQGMELLERVRRICGDLPEAEESIDGFGHNVFKVRGKSFVIMGENEEGPRLSFKSTKEQQYVLLQQGGYVKTPYIGHHGWVSVDRAAPPDWDERAELIREAYLLAAPKRLARMLEQEV